jgi:hypothetical protein
MPQAETAYFALLKQQIVSTLQQSVPGVSSSIESWKGQEIVHFQEDLEKRAKGRISEKWFYTHIKDENDKLPRIDILNLLSKYCGYLDWADFKLKNNIAENNLENEPLSKSHRKWISVSAVVIIIIIGAIFLFRPKTYQFYFIDADKKSQITNQPIDIVVLSDNQSPRHFRCNDGCFSIRTRKDKIRFIVKAPYYRVDTITRFLNAPKEEIHLSTNDYALMIHFFSKAQKDDWTKRRKQLDLMISENAQIFQVYDEDGVGMELFNKQEFINKLTMPVRSLNNIEVIETIYTGSRISMLKFRQKTNP